jgi:hypothetical protein
MDVADTRYSRWPPCGPSSSFGTYGWDYSAASGLDGDRISVHIPYKAMDSHVVK